MKKFWIWSCVVLGIIITFIILIFTLFTLKNAEIKFHNNTTLFATEEIQNEILEKANLPYNHTVLGINKKTIIQNLEKEYPYLEVINIETVFPNKFILHLNQREGVFAVQFDCGYYFCDADFKILEISTNQHTSTQNNFIEIHTLSTLPNTLECGDFIDIEENKVLKNISPAFELTNRNIFDQMACIKQINIIYDSYNPQKPLSEKSVGLEMIDFAGLKVQIVGADSLLAEKINSFFTYQTQVTNPNTHYLYIYEDTNNQILTVQKAYPTE